MSMILVPAFPFSSSLLLILFLCPKSGTPFSPRMNDGGFQAILGVNQRLNHCLQSRSPRRQAPPVALPRSSSPSRGLRVSRVLLKETFCFISSIFFHRMQNIRVDVCSYIKVFMTQDLLDHLEVYSHTPEQC